MPQNPGTPQERALLVIGAVFVIVFVGVFWLARRRAMQRRKGVKD